MDTLRLVLSVTWKELQLISKDRGALGVLFLLPLLIGALVATPNLMFARESAETKILLDVSLVNLDSGNFGAEVAKALREVDILNVTSLATVAAAEAELSAARSKAAIVLPADFSSGIDAHSPVRVTVIADPTQPESADIVVGIMNQVLSEATLWGEVQYGVRTLLNESDLINTLTPEQQRAVAAQNLGAIMTRLNELRRNPLIVVSSENLAGTEEDANVLARYFAYLFAGFTVMFIFFIVGMAASSLLEERETGVLRRLVAAPVPPTAIIAGKMLAYMSISCLQVIVLLTVSHVAFDVPLGQSPLALVVLTLSVAFAATALAMMLASLGRDPQQVDSLGTILGFVLAGVGGAIAVSPNAMFYRSEGFMGMLARLTPHAHALEGFFKVMTEDAGLVDVLPQAGVVLAMGVAFMLVARWRFRFEG